MFATPARNRTSQSRAPSSVPRSASNAQRGTPSSGAKPRTKTTPRTIQIRDLPPYEAPEAPLNRDAQCKLAALLHSQHKNSVQTHLGHATQVLTESAGQVNEKLFDARLRYEKLREGRRNASAISGEEPDDSVDNEELERLGDLERRTDAVTGQMEEKMRGIIDSEARLQAILGSISQLQREEEENQAASAGPRQTRAQRRRDDDEEESEGENYEGTPEREGMEARARNPPSKRLGEVLDAEGERWKELSLTERYAGHNSYVGFYRMVHDAKFPNEEAPPLPHSSTWFEHMEDSNATTSAGQQTRSTRNRRQPSDDSDDDIAIQRERISMKCPLTLLPYQDPVTSTKCPHSFEREAILDMIRGSSMTAPGPGRGRVRALKCPVCSTILTKEDLRADPVLLRRVRRAEEVAAREAEDQLEGQSQLPNSPNHITLASDAIEPEMDVDVDIDDAPVPSARVKSEPVDRARSTDEEEEEDEEVDEEEEEEEEDEESDVEMGSD
ncbi:Zinc finger RING/FYVE/PHD-type [Penicillium angulare]|uniref:Zinc finger RING/FYVE/PHD-type n=1 Tax=Penicillium angulare TaxID=116970 RepID=UPI002540A424|nr:Zinc finger RING/FYVE/PHD-type [Penicillium angulare]KAJ5287438.1 Zinc finger RING/FYVE/PHD-type [Penicillium angulare]